MRTLAIVTAVAVLTFGQSRAEELLPKSRSIESAIDHYVDSLAKQDEITFAPQADDAALVRRLTLDLVGRIPTTAESDEFVKTIDPAKRAKLIDRLIASPGFIRHQAAQFDVMLNSTVAGGDTKKGTVREYLVAALKDGKAWDKIFRELMLPDETDPKQKGASEYLRGRVADADKLTNDVSVAFFGVNVSCAQCHDHPLVADWKQDHFFGMKSFLVRTYDANGFLAERDVGLVKFKPTKGPEKTAKLMFLTGTEVKTDTLREPTKDEQKKEKDFADKSKANKTAPPPPTFSARAKFVDLALKPGESEFFARSIANRLWHRFLGTGLVNPLDQMHSENLPAMPELLAWLARDVAANGYDLKRLTRGIVMSQTYSRSSQSASQSPTPSKYFAVAKLKPMTPMQLASSLKIATSDPATFEKLKDDEFERRLESIDSAARGFAGTIAQPTDDFQIGVGEALLFSNSDRIGKEFLTDGSGTLLSKTKLLKDPAEVAELMVKTAFGRPAKADEKAAIVEYLQKRNDRSAEAQKQVLWALVTSAEFRFNY